MDQDVRRLTNCSVCLCNFRDPRILPCGHSFCFKCLDELITINDHIFRCPRCRKAYRCHSAAHLPPNIDLRYMVEGFEEAVHKESCSGFDGTQPAANIQACAENNSTPNALWSKIREKHNFLKVNGQNLARSMDHAVRDACSHCSASVLDLRTDFEMICKNIDEAADVLADLQASQNICSRAKTSAVAVKKLEVVELRILDNKKYPCRLSRQTVAKLVRETVQALSNAAEVPKALVQILKSYCVDYDWHAWLQRGSSTLLDAYVQGKLKDGARFAVECRSCCTVQLPSIDDALHYLEHAAKKFSKEKNPAKCISQDCNLTLRGSCWLCGCSEETVCISCSDPTRQFIRHRIQNTEYVLWQFS